MSTESVLAIIFAFFGLFSGTILAIFFNNKSGKYVEYAESLASGFMLAVVFFDLIPSANEKANFLTIILGILAGVLLILLANCISRLSLSAKSGKYGISKKNTLDISANIEVAQKTSNKQLIRNLTTAFAVALHNIPEGIALGSLNGQQVLVGAAILIALHNIPEGIAMSIPLAKIGVKWHKILFFAFLTGACTVVGWGIGILVGGISNEFVAFLLAISSGAMLQIVFGDLMGHSKNNYSGGITLIGLLVGMVIANFV